MNALTAILIYLFQTILGLYLGALILRFLLQIVRADFYNPISQFLVKITNPVVLPVRRIIPGYGGLDLSSLLLAYLLQVIGIAVFAAVRFNGLPSAQALILGGIVGLLGLLVQIYFFAILGSIIMSWVAQGGQHPALYLLRQLTEPVMAPFRKLLPPMGGLDLSPILIFLLLPVINIVLHQLAASVGVSASHPGYRESMTHPEHKHSVGIVTPQVAHFDEPLQLSCGRVLPTYDLVFETYGELNEARSNAVLVCHALSGHHHAAGFHSHDEKKAGWWDTCIGPGKSIDTNRFFVVSLNNLGGCHGSTGPTSINPETGHPWGPDFPHMRSRDWVHSQARLADSLGIDCWAAVIGGSLGGMQAMRWSIEFPERIKHCVVIAAALKLSAQNLAFNEVARQAIETDPEFAEGHYLQQGKVPAVGLSLARMIGHITYLSDDAMANRFGRDLRSGSLDQGGEATAEFQVQSYLRYQGSQFSGNFDANTYILMTRALDYFDLALEYDNDPAAAFRQSKCSFMVISFSTDWRFSPQRSQEIVNALIAADRPVSYAEIEANEGHDAFLMPIPRYLNVLSAYMQRVGEVS